MNELIHKSAFYNVIGGQFYRNGKFQGKVYNWYLPSKLLTWFRTDDVVVLENNARLKINQLSYEVEAERQYESFPYKAERAGWLLQRLERHLNSLGYNCYFGGHYHGLKNEFGPLTADVVFKVGEQICYLEFKGIRHYKFEARRNQKRLADLDAKRAWCRRNQVPLLEVPCWYAGELNNWVDDFIAVVKADPSTKTEL